jgi:hypothetical protein
VACRTFIDFGPEHAKGFGDRHERCGGPEIERTMDQRNNAIGRDVGDGRTYAQALDRCAELADSGQLWIIVDGRVVQG